MKQTRNAITFLQAQYRALLQRVVWSRFAFISAFAGVCAPVVSSVVLAATPSGYAYTYTTSDYGLSHRMQDAYGVEQVCAEGADPCLSFWDHSADTISSDTASVFFPQTSSLTVNSHTHLSAEQLQALESAYQNISYEQDAGLLSLGKYAAQSVDIVAPVATNEAKANKISSSSEVNSGADSASDASTARAAAPSLSAAADTTGADAPTQDLPLERISVQDLDIAARSASEPQTTPFKLHLPQLGNFDSGEGSYSPLPLADQKPLAGKLDTHYTAELLSMDLSAWALPQMPSHQVDAESSVFAAEQPQYLARTTSQGQLQVQAADGTQLFFASSDAASTSTVPAQLGVFTPYSVEELSSNTHGYGEGADSWLQVSLAEGQSYDIVVESDEDWFNLLSGFASSEDGTELVVDVSALGHAQQPSTLKIDGSFFEPQSPSRFAFNAVADASSAAHAPATAFNPDLEPFQGNVQGSVLVRPHGNVEELSAQWHQAAQQQHQSATNTPSDLIAAQDPSSHLAGPLRNAVLDLQQVRYEQELNGQPKMNLALHLDADTTLVLKDKVSLPQGTSEQTFAAVAAANKAQPVLKSGRSSVFASASSEVAPALTVKLDQVGAGAASTLDTLPNSTNDQDIALTFSHGPNSRNVPTENVRFIVDPSTALEVDVSALEQSRLAIASSEALEQDGQSRVVVKRDPSSQLLRISGADLSLPMVAQANDTANAVNKGTSSAPATDSDSLVVPVISLQPASDKELKVNFASVNAAQVPVSASAASTSTSASTSAESDSAVLLAGSYERLQLPADAQWVEVPAGKTLELRGASEDLSLGSSQDQAQDAEAVNANVNSNANVNGNVNVNGNGNGNAVDTAYFVLTPDRKVVDVKLQPEALLHLFGNGNIGSLTGFGGVSLQDAKVKVQDRSGAPADVKVKDVSLERSSLQVRDLSASHFNAHDSSVQARSLVIKSPMFSAFANQQDLLPESADGAVKSVAAAAEAAETVGAEPSFVAVNSNLQAQYMDLRAANMAKVQGGILEAQELRANQLYLSDGASAFVQHIELQDLNSTLSVGSGFGAQSSKLHISGAAGAASAAGAAGTTGVDAGAEAPAVRVVEPDSSKSIGASGSTGAVSATGAESGVQPQIAPISWQKHDEVSWEEQAYNQPLLLQWNDQKVQHTSLFASSINLQGGLLQLYGAPQEQVTVFTRSLEGRNDDGLGSMDLSGNIIIGRNSALGIGSDFKSFATAYNKYQDRQQQVQAQLKNAAQHSKQQGAVLGANVSPYSVFVEASGAGTEALDAGGAGSYLYVDRSGINLGDHKIIMGTEDLSYLQSMLQSPYSIYLGLGSTMQVSARALYGVDAYDANMSVFSDMDGKVVASRHGNIIVPIANSQDISRLFGSGVYLRQGDVIHVTTENGLFSGKITNSEQLRGKQHFNFNMTGDPREVLSELAAPTLEQSLRIMSTVTSSFDANAFELQNEAQSVTDALDTQSLDDLSSVTAAGISDVLNTDLTNVSTSITDSNTVTDSTNSSISNTVTSDTANSVANATNSILDSTTNDISSTVSDTVTSDAATSDVAANGATGAIVEVTDGVTADAVAGSSGGSSSGSGSGASSGSAVASASSSTPRKPISVDKSSYGYAFLMDALGSRNSEVIEKVTRMATLGGALHSVYLVAGTASESMHSRLGVGVNAALAVNSERKGNITISENGQGSSLWMTPMYRSFNADDLSAQGREYGTDLELFGMVMGLDLSPADNWRLGLMWNVGAGSAEGKDVASGIDNDFSFFGLGLYAGTNVTKGLAVGADISYAQVNNDLSADAKISNWGKMQAETDSSSLSVGVGAQYTVHACQMEVSPHVGLRYNRLDLDSYDVKIDGNKVASSRSDDMHIVSIPLGITFARDYGFESWVLRPAFDFTFTTNIGDTEMDSSTTFAGITGADFEYTTDILDRFTYGATVGMSASSDQLSFGLNVGYTGSANTSDVIGSAQLRYVF